jgi:hypothetical protein
MRILPFVAVLAAVVAVVIAGPAVAQERLTGVVNCAIAKLHRCDIAGCKTREPRNVEISIDFDRDTACIRHGGACRKQRAFTVSDGRGGARMLVFAHDGMTIRLARDWAITGGEVQAGRSTVFFGRCGRG